MNVSKFNFSFYKFNSKYNYMNTSKPTYIETHKNDYNDYFRGINKNSIKNKKIKQLSSLSETEIDNLIKNVTETIFCLEGSILYLIDNIDNFDISTFITFMCILNNLQCDINNINITIVDNKIKRIMIKYINKIKSLNKINNEYLKTKYNYNLKSTKNFKKRVIFVNNIINFNSQYENYKKSFMIRIAIYIFKKTCNKFIRVIEDLGLYNIFDTKIDKVNNYLKDERIKDIKNIDYELIEENNNYINLNLTFNKLLKKKENKSAFEDGFESSKNNDILSLNKKENKSAFERSNSNQREYIQQLATVEQNSKPISVFTNDTVNTKKFTDDLRDIGMNKKFTKNEYNQLPEIKKMIFTVIPDIKYLIELYKNIKDPTFNQSNINISKYINNYKSMLNYIEKDSTINNKEIIIEIINKIKKLFELIKLIINNKSTGRSTTKMINQLNEDIKYIL
jgi:hypothetical protein